MADRKALNRRRGKAFHALFVDVVHPRARCVARVVLQRFLQARQVAPDLVALHPARLVP